jgi:glycosyltransferase involved in cell wall biosynthesis
LGICHDVPALLSDASLLLLTSDSEGLPNVVLEALALGVPVVAPAIGDLPTLVTKDCGVLVAPDIDELTSGVLSTLTNLPWNQILVGTDQIAERYSIETMVTRTTAVWGRAFLGTSRKSRRLPPGKILVSTG